MDSKTEQNSDSATGKEVNINIHTDPDTTAVKCMSPDEGLRVGLSKEELMKYANEPFWVRLRNTLFAAFWIVWVSILVAAIGYVIHSPGCKMVSAAATGAVTNSTVPS